MSRDEQLLELRQQLECLDRAIQALKSLQHLNAVGFSAPTAQSGKVLVLESDRHTPTPKQRRAKRRARARILQFPATRTDRREGLSQLEVEKLEGLR